MSAAEVARLEREAAGYAPQIRRIMSGLEAVAAGRSPEYTVARAMLDRGTIVRNPARHGHAGETLEVSPGVFVARCSCGFESPGCSERADDGGDVYDGGLWAAVAVDMHAAEANAGVPLYVFTREGERFARAARRFGTPGGAR